MNLIEFSSFLFSLHSVLLWRTPKSAFQVKNYSTKKLVGLVGKLELPGVTKNSSPHWFWALRSVKLNPLLSTAVKYLGLKTFARRIQI